MVAAFFKLHSQTHSLVCTVTIPISFFPFLYALLVFNVKIVSFTRFLHLAVSSVERSFFPWPGPESTVIMAVVAAMEAGFPVQEPSLTSAWALGSLLSFLLEANPRILSYRLKPGLTQVRGEAFGCCVCSSNSCWVFRDLAAQSIPRSAVWVPAKLKSSEGQSWKSFVITFHMGVILCHC